jgi:hypothetical protein
MAIFGRCKVPMIQQFDDQPRGCPYRRPTPYGVELTFKIKY